MKESILSSKEIQEQIEYITLPIKKMQDQLECAVRPINQMQEQIKIAENTLTIAQKSIPKLIISKEQIEYLNLPFITITESINRIQEPLRVIKETLSKIKFETKLNAVEVKKLKELYWVIPYDMPYEELTVILSGKTTAEFNKFIIEYFDKTKIDRMILDISNNFENEDKKEILRQIKIAMDNELYALVITVLVTLLDGLTLELLNPSSTYQHKSYKAIESMLEYISESPVSEYGYELYLKIYILNNFYLILYKNVGLKNNNRLILSRHLNSHGVKYLNNKLDCLRILNTIYFCQEIIKETKMQNMFSMKKKDGIKKFKLVEHKKEYIN